MSDYAEAMLVAIAKVGVKELKSEQEYVIHCFLVRHDGFAVMPTWKGMMYLQPCLLCKGMMYLQPCLLCKGMMYLQSCLLGRA